MPNWSGVLSEIESLQTELNSQSAVDIVRRNYLKELSKKTKRNVIAYYSGWLSKPGLEGGQINDEDKNGFMVAVHELDRNHGLDLILHTPGGELPATESIIDYLYRMFDDNIRAVVPQIAMSGGTLIACSCKRILMGAQSNLGPIDPQVFGVPAKGIIEEINTALDDISDDPNKVHIWQPILSKYHPTFISQCINAIRYSSELARHKLEQVMFKNDSDKRNKAKQIVDGLTDYSENKFHERHIHIDDCRDLGLKITELEEDQDLQDLVLTIHHAYMYTLMNTASIKIIENHLGRALVKWV